MKRVGAALFAAALAAGAAAQEISLGVTMPPGGIAFGDAFEVTVERSWSLAFVPDEFDERSLAPLLVELVATERSPVSATIGPPVSERRRYRARCFAAGDVKVGPLTIRCRQGEVEVTGTSGQVVLSVRSSLPEPAGGFEWPGDVRELPARSRWVWLAGIAALLLGGLWWWRRPRAVAVVLPIEAAPQPTALRDLRTLRAPGDDAGAAAVVAFVTDVKRLLRQHCRERFAVAAEVCTSEELQRAVPPSAPLTGCLHACDLALFGAVLPPAAERARMLAAAIAFAEGSA